MNEEELIDMAKQVGMRYREIEDEFHSGYADGVYLDELEAFAKLIEKKEREACAKEVENALYGQEGCGKAAKAIRARGNPLYTTPQPEQGDKNEVWDNYGFEY